MKPVEKLNRMVWELLVYNRLLDHKNVKTIFQRGLGSGVWAFYRDLCELPIMQKVVIEAERAPVMDVADSLLREFNEHGGYVMPRGSDILTDNFSEFIRIPTAGEYDITQFLSAVLFSLNVHTYLYRNGVKNAAVEQTIKELTFKAYILFRAIGMAQEIE